MAGGGAGREHETGFGMLVLPFAQEFEGGEGFTHTDGVKVDGAAGFEVGWTEIETDAFVERGSKATTAQHFQDPTGKSDEEKQRQDRAVDEESEESFHAKVSSK